MWTRRALLAGAAVLAAAPARADDDVSSQTLRSGRMDRRYRLVRPENLPVHPPLVIAFHGVADNPANMARYSHLDEAARAHGWLLAYPRSLGARWPYQNIEASMIEVDFIAALIDALTHAHTIDIDRVHMTGMSGGGYFVNFVAAHISERIASIAAHSGGAGGLALSGFNAARKYPVLVIHGDADEVVPIRSGRALVEQYRREGHPVDYWEVPGLGHRWAYAQGVNERIAAFFVAHPRDQSP